MELTTKDRDLANKMAEQRKKDKSAIRKTVNAKPLWFRGIRNTRMYGQDGHGKLVNLKVELNGWKVRLEYRIEKSSDMGKEFKEGDPIPRTTTSIVTDIYHAVRAVKHITSGHAKEREHNELLCRSIDTLNSVLYGRGSKLDDAKLSEMRNRLAAMMPEKKDGETFDCKSGYKLLAWRKVEPVLGLLEQAMKETTDFEKRTRITVACDKLVAFKSRYLWRYRQAYKIDKYEGTRLDGLRAERDRQLREMLRGMAKKLNGNNGFGVACTLVSDTMMICAMELAEKKISKGKHREALKIIEVCGRQLKSDYIKEKLRDIYRFVSRSMRNRRKGWREEAREQLEDFKRMLGQRNTRYVLNELKKTKDAYLEGEGGAVKLMEAGNAKIVKALAGDYLRRSIAWVEEIRAEAAESPLESKYIKLTNRRRDGSDEEKMWKRKKLILEASRDFAQAAAALLAPVPA